MLLSKADFQAENLHINLALGGEGGSFFSPALHPFLPGLTQG